MKNSFDYSQAKQRYENSLNAILVADDKGNYISANQAAADMLKYNLSTMK